MRRLVSAQADIETGAAARLDEASSDELIIGLDHGGTTDSRFLSAIADGGQPRAGTQRMSLDSLRQARGELRGQAMVLFGL
jgi:hypothetical protein